MGAKEMKMRLKTADNQEHDEFWKFTGMVWSHLKQDRWYLEITRSTKDVKQIDNDITQTGQ